MVDQTSYMFITGPDVIKTVTGESVTQEELGGAHAHNTKSGVAHYQAADEQDCLAFARDLLSYLPSNNLEEPPRSQSGPPDPAAALAVTDYDRELDTLIPDSPRQPYDIHTVIEHVLDDEEFLEIHAEFAQNIVVGFGRVDGSPVGVVANQPMHSAGTLDIDASEKAARFVRTCDAFSVPVVTFVDVPGFLPGTGQEWGGIIRRGAKLIYAYAEATVPKITIITRKAYGGAYDVMGSKHLGGDINLAWPTAQIADGRRWRGGHPVPAGPGRHRGPAGAGRPAGPEGGRVRGHAVQPVHRGRARLRGRHHPAGRDPLPGGPGAAHPADQAPDPSA
jgi:propionyl-CoA carboxylase beta chain